MKLLYENIIFNKNRRECNLITAMQDPNFSEEILIVITKEKTIAFLQISEYSLIIIRETNFYKSTMSRME